VNDRNADFARCTFQTLGVDILLTAKPVFKHVLENHATTHQFREIGVPCATVDGLIILKLYPLPSLYRQGDFQRAALYESDITMLARRYRSPLGSLLAALRPRMDTGDLEELSNIVREIEQRISRMERTPKTAV